jgi:hypothetical protein
VRYFSTRDGSGTEYYSNGEKFEGIFINDSRAGYGTYSTIFENKFTGYWYNDKKNGPGKLSLNDGTRYHGDFKNDKREGYGKSINSQRVKYIGYWLNDTMHGLGVEYIPNGHTTDVIFEHGQYSKVTVYTPGSNHTPTPPYDPGAIGVYGPGPIES